MITIITEIAYFDGDCYMCNEGGGSDDKWPMKNFFNLTLRVRTSCNKLLKNCIWNINERFDCCSRFKMTFTEYGPCYSLNSRQISFRNLLPLMVNRNMIKERLMNGLHETGVVEFEVTADSTMFIHSPEDIPSWNTLDEFVHILAPSTKVQLIYNVREIDDESGVNVLSVNQRGCRKRKEKTTSLNHPVYGYTVCRMECRAKLMMSLCNCSNHFLLFSFTVPCNREGLSCISSFSNYLKALELPPNRSDIPHYDCPCMPACLEPDYWLIWGPLLPPPSTTDTAMVKISLGNLPYVRFKRNIVHGQLDMVVSFGGIVGLTLGASLISIVELIYFVFVRPLHKNKNQKMATEKILNISLIYKKTRKL